MLDLGGHGIVGAALQVTETPGDSFTAATVEIKVIGTAVRAQGCPPLPRPFTTEMSGPDFAKLLMDGWVPAGIALGISVAGLHDTCRPAPAPGARGTRRCRYTDLMVYVRQDALIGWRRRYARWALTACVSAMTLHVRSDDCRAHPGGADHFAQAVITGTAVAQFSRRAKATPAPSLTVLPLDPHDAKSAR